MSASWLHIFVGEAASLCFGNPTLKYALSFSREVESFSEKQVKEIWDRLFTVYVTSPKMRMWEKKQGCHRMSHTQTFYAQCAFDFHCFLDDSLLYLGSCDQKETCTVTCPSHAYLSIRAWLKRIGWIVLFDSTKLNLKYDTAKSMPITLSLDRKKGSLSAMPSFWLPEIEEFITRFMIAPRPCKKHVRATVIASNLYQHELWPKGWSPSRLW